MNMERVRSNNIKLLQLIMLILVFFSLFFVISCERSPKPLPQEDYELLCKSLEEGKIKMEMKYDSITKRVYRLFKSGRYKLEIREDPITGNEEKKLVRYFILYFKL